MLQPLNYSTHAIEDLTEFANKAKRMGMPKTSLVCQQLVGLLSRAVKFILPENGELLSLSELDGSYSDLVRLPFDAVALEAPWYKGQDVYTGDDAFLEEPSTRRIALAWRHKVWAKDFPLLVPEGIEEDGFIVSSIYYYDNARTWSVAPMAEFMAEGAFIGRGIPDDLPEASRLERDFLLSRGTVAPKNSFHESISWLMMPEMGQYVVQEIGSIEKARARMCLDVRDEVLTTVGFVLTLNASNVGRVKIDPPEKLNRKRAINGKPPFFENWVLDLQVGQDRHGRAETGGTAVDGRASPRLHLRRGHLRRLADRRVVYVRPTTVGSVSQGMVDKTYNVRR